MGFLGDWKKLKVGLFFVKMVDMIDVLKLDFLWIRIILEYLRFSLLKKFNKRIGKVKNLLFEEFDV